MMSIESSTLAGAPYPPVAVALWSYIVAFEPSLNLEIERANTWNG